MGECEDSLEPTPLYSMLDRGHHSMRKVRTWVAVLGIGVPCVIVAIAMTTNWFSSAGSIYGQVTYKGKPLDRGFVLFYPTDETETDWVVGPIDKNGSYSIHSGWRHHSGKKRFRICIIPRKGKPAAHVDLTGQESHSKVIPVELNSKGDDSHQLVAVDIGFPHRYTNIATSGLQITLGREPVQIDIDLKD